MIKTHLLVLSVIFTACLYASPVADYESAVHEAIKEAPKEKAGLRSERIRKKLKEKNEKRIKAPIENEQRVKKEIEDEVKKMVSAIPPIKEEPNPKGGKPTSSSNSKDNQKIHTTNSNAQRVGSTGTVGEAGGAEQTTFGKSGQGNTPSKQTLGDPLGSHGGAEEIRFK